MTQVAQQRSRRRATWSFPKGIRETIRGPFIGFLKGMEEKP